MALYEVAHERVLLSAHRLQAGGVAELNTEDSDKVKENGQNQVIFYPLMRGTLVFTEEGDLDGAPEGKDTFYAFNKAEVEEYAGLGALEEVEDASELEVEDLSDPRSFGVPGQDDGTDLDAAMGDEIRTAEEEGTLEEKFNVDLGSSDEQDASEGVTDESDQQQQDEEDNK